MKVLFQKPRWATATRKVSALALCAPATADKPSNRAITRVMARSILLDVLLSHHAAPARELVVQERAELRARRRRRNGAGGHELLAHVRRLERGGGRIVQFRHYRRRRLRR